MKALVFRHSLAREAASAIGGRVDRRAFVSRFAPARIEDVAEPPLPAADWVRVRTTFSGLCGSATSSRRAGANLDTNARRSTRPPMAEAASRVRLCRNTSAFTPPSFEPVRAVRHGTMAGPAVPAGWTSTPATWATKLRIATVAQRRRIASSSPAPEGPGCAR